MRRRSPRSRPPFSSGNRLRCAPRAPTCPRSSSSIIQRCLAKQPGQRFQDVSELAIALAPFAPPRARVLIERCCSILQGAGMTRAGDGAVPLAASARAGKRADGSDQRGRLVDGHGGGVHPVRAIDIEVVAVGAGCSDTRRGGRRRDARPQRCERRGARDARTARRAGGRCAIGRAVHPVADAPLRPRDACSRGAREASRDGHSRNTFPRLPTSPRAGALRWQARPPPRPTQGPSGACSRLSTSMTARERPRKRGPSRRR